MSELDSFLSAGTQPPDPSAPAPAPPAPPQPGPTPPTPPPAAKPEPKDAKPEAKAEPPKPEPEPEPDDDIGHDGNMIPPSVFNKARTDWKSKVVEAQTQARMLREQIEAIQKQQAAPPPAPPAYQPPVVLDPARDPVGYHNRLQEVLLNDRLNMSELMEKEKHPPEVFEAAVNEFKDMAIKDPALFAKLHQQQHPYGWLMKEVQRLRLQREVGDDPEGYKARLRAEWEAEQQRNAEAPISPAAGLPPSLATTRSAAPRSTNGFSGPPPLEDIFARPKRRP
jgi:hypothetical protein